MTRPGRFCESGQRRTGRGASTSTSTGWPISTQAVHVLNGRFISRRGILHAPSPVSSKQSTDSRTKRLLRQKHFSPALDTKAVYRQAGLVKLGHVALDGTKVRANASKHRAMSYGRMKEREEHLAAEVSELLRRAQEVDDDDDRRYGADGRGDELPEELAFREGRLERIREAMAALAPIHRKDECRGMLKG